MQVNEAIGGWAIVEEKNCPAVHGPRGELRTHVWGVDLSGTLNGAALASWGFHRGWADVIGLGEHTPPACALRRPAEGKLFLHTSNAATEQRSSEHEYGPFGELLRATGPLAETFNHLFSTKYHDWETGLYYYGYRYYNPTTGRWLSRDPIGERGGVNLYGFVYNNPTGNVDADGREIGSICQKCGQYHVGPLCPRCDQPPTVSEETAKFVVGLTPVVGSAVQAESNFSQGNYGWGAFYSALAVSDVFLVRSIATGLGKGCWKVGSHTWSATRSWFGRTRSVAPNTEVHHWLLQQNQGIGMWFPEWFKNQPWNLVVIDSGVVHGARYSSKTIHLAVHGRSKELTLNWIERAAYGTPDWAQWAALNFSMRATTLFEQDCQCSLEHPGQTVIREGENQIVIPSSPSLLDPVFVVP